MTDRIQCAIYTRKSSEEGLEQEFNSLDAQYESCVAYIASQAIEGWKLVPTKYDDGGISGGTINRPALQQLLADIKSGLVDIIVVYKIDRLTRSLNDFAKIVEILDATGATFVSVTQSFNTATSMGRLTLHMLLSFAQFEREVTTERIRDKIKASKQKGMFMGGNVAMGYKVKDRHLYVDEHNAKFVNILYEKYLELGCVGKVADWLEERDLFTPIKTSQTGKITGGCKFSYGHIHSILTNPIYIGKIKHYKEVYNGRHNAIINAELWKDVQDKLQSKASVGRDKKYTKGNHCLTSIIFDETGDRLSPSGSIKDGVRHRYYTSNRILCGSAKDHPNAWRLPANELEKVVQQSILNHIKNNIWTDEISQLDAMQNKVANLFESDSWAKYLSKIVVHNRKLEITLNYKKLSEILSLEINKKICKITALFEMQRKANGKKVIIGAEQNYLDIPLLKLYMQSCGWYQKICSGESILDIAKSDSVSDSYIRRMIDMAFLSPDIVKQLSQGKQPIIMSKEYLKNNGLPDCWNEQLQMLNKR